MKALRHAMLRGALHAARRLAFPLLLLFAACSLPYAPLGPVPASAQEYEQFVEVVPDSAFEAKPKTPANYQTSYGTFDANHDGYLSADEYYSAQAWPGLDRNGDGVVDSTEWPW